MKFYPTFSEVWNKGMTLLDKVVFGIWVFSLVVNIIAFNIGTACAAAVVLICFYFWKYEELRANVYEQIVAADLRKIAHLNPEIKFSKNDETDRA